MKISILGLGAMGRRMAERAVTAGHDVTVWSRSSSPRLDGARSSPSADDAVAECDVAFSMVTDDAASKAVWLDEGALDALPSTAVGIESSTVSRSWSLELAEAASARGTAFLDAPVLGSRPQAEAGQLIFLVGGEAAHLAQVRPVLEDFGGAVYHVGDAGAGASAKLVANGLFGIQVAALGELIGAADSWSEDAARIIEILSQTPVVSPAAAAAAQGMLSGRFPAAFPIDLVAKDFSLLTADLDADSAPIARATRDVYRSARDRGFGQHNITGVVQLYRAV